MVTQHPWALLKNQACIPMEVSQLEKLGWPGETAEGRLVHSHGSLVQEAQDATTKPYFYHTF